MAPCKTNTKTFILGIFLFCLSHYNSATRLNREELVRRNKILKDKVKRLEHVVVTLEGKVKRNVLKGDNTERKFKELLTEYEQSDLNNNYKQQNSVSAVRPFDRKRQVLSETSIAFSTYMNHDVDKLGSGQAILFNQILLNDGGGYNKYTGAFTAPIDGIYVFSFFVGERGVNQILTTLSVNGVQESHAVVETGDSLADGQGGNVAILKLSKGDVAMVLHVTHSSKSDSHLEGAPDARLSTFSGFLHYAGTPEIVGK